MYALYDTHNIKNGTITCGAGVGFSKGSWLGGGLFDTAAADTG